MALTVAQEIAVAHKVKERLEALEALPLNARAHRIVASLHATLAKYAKDRGHAIDAPDGEIHVLGGDDKEQPA